MEGKSLHLPSIFLGLIFGIGLSVGTFFILPEGTLNTSCVVMANGHDISEMPQVKFETSSLSQNSNEKRDVAVMNKGVACPSTKNTNSSSLALRFAPAMDRLHEDTVTLDVEYALHVDASVWRNVPHTYDSVMTALHETNIWKDKALNPLINHLGAKTTDKDLFGSTLQKGILDKLIRDLKPKILVEVGVFRGSTSISLARLLDELKLDDSFIISIDTWLLDLRFVWRSPQLLHQTQISRYFKNLYVGGASHMYYLFLSNVLMTSTSHRIVPMQSASSNAAMALIAHSIRPDFFYIDASHANPDVYIDLENYYNILKPGGALAFDDYDVAAVHAAVDALAARHNLKTHIMGHQGYVLKPLE